ncbi:MAG: hypothetical protein MJ144_02460 [Clostridia bacterium]|nr:hypothetical protein [Clostridia bacterium]
MDLSLVLAIIAGILFAVFCVLCLIVLKKNREEAELQQKHMKAIENNIYRVGDMISRNSEMIEQQLAHAEEVKATKTEAPAAEPEGIEETDFDDDFDFEIDLEDIVEEEPAPPVPAPATRPAVDPITEILSGIKKLEEEEPQKGKMTFDTGKSGRKYTAEELKKLIR